MSDAIRIRTLSFAYGKQPVLEAVSLAIGKGEMVAILGPNGSGKTTLLKILSGVLVGTGEVEINGLPLDRYDRRELSRVSAVVPQENPVLFPYRAGEIVSMARACHHGPFALESARDREIVRASLEMTETFALADRYLHELSGGEKQRVIIARALSQQPEILLLDEPSAYLDLRHQVGILSLLRRLNRDRGITVMAALHDLNLAAAFFPRLVLLREGRVYRDGPPRDVLTEETVREVYGVEVEVTPDPRFGCRVMVRPTW